MGIKNYECFVNESYRKILISIATILGLGLTKIQAQEIKNDDNKLSIIKSLGDYNTNPKGIVHLENVLSSKIQNPDIFIEEYLKMNPDKTVTVLPNFLDFKIDIISKNRFDLTYKIEF